MFDSPRSCPQNAKIGERMSKDCQKDSQKSGKSVVKIRSMCREISSCPRLNDGKRCIKKMMYKNLKMMKSLRVKKSALSEEIDEVKGLKQ